VQRHPRLPRARRHGAGERGAADAEAPRRGEAADRRAPVLLHVDDALEGGGVGAVEVGERAEALERGEPVGHEPLAAGLVHGVVAALEDRDREPARAASSATASPAGPPPTTATSGVTGGAILA
jgi:hypothetical protein